jgi:hypothetical protein
MDDEFLLYRAPSGAVSIQVRVQEETVWLTQRALAELFGVTIPAISKHLRNILDSGELFEESVVSILETTAADGKNYQTRSRRSSRPRSNMTCTVSGRMRNTYRTSIARCVDYRAGQLTTLKRQLMLRPDDLWSIRPRISS